MRTFLAACVSVVALLNTPASAQMMKFDKVNKLSALSGQRIQIAVLGRVTPQCQNAPVEIKLAQKPLNGKVTAAKGKLTKGSVANCPELQPDSAILFYTSNPDFKGKDRVAILVIYEGKRNGEVYEIDVK